VASNELRWSDFRLVKSEAWGVQGGRRVED
jgi:hypothetical protein